MAINFMLSYIILDKKIIFSLKIVIKFASIVFFILSPLSILLLFQGYFLPYHSQGILNFQRSAILFDSFIIIILWPTDLCIFNAKHETLEKASKLPLDFVNFFKKTIPISTASAVCLISLLLLALPQEPQNSRQILSNIPIVQWINTVFPCNLDLPNHIFISTTPNQELLGYYAKSISKHEKTFIDLIKIQNLGINLRNRDLSNANFSGSKFPSGNFSGSKLEYTDFKGTLLQNAQFDNTKLINTNFREADLQSANFSDSEIIDTIFPQAKLQNAYFTKTKIYKSNFSSSEIQGAMFYKVDISETNFSSSHLQGSVLISCTIIDSDISKSDLQGIYTRDTVIFGCNISESQICGADLEISKLIANDFSFSEFEGTDLSRSQFQFSSFINSRFILANAAFTNFSMSEFQPKKIDSSNFESANFDDLHPNAQEALTNGIYATFPSSSKNMIDEKIKNQLAARTRHQPIIQTNCYFDPSKIAASWTWGEPTRDNAFEKKFHAARSLILRMLSCDNQFVEQKIFDQLSDKYLYYHKGGLKLKAPLSIIPGYTQIGCDSLNEIMQSHDKELIKKYNSLKNNI